MAEIKSHPGYVGFFTKSEGRGCWRNGTRVVKDVSEEGDATPSGTEGTVLGSLQHPVYGKFYFIEWDDKPKIAIGCMELKLRRVTDPRGVSSA